MGTREPGGGKPAVAFNMAAATYMLHGMMNLKTNSRATLK